MKIYTRTGDHGTTGLLGGRRVSKTELHVEACGAIDELNAALGLAVGLARAPGAARAAELQGLQAGLFALGAELAATPEAREDLVHAGTVRLVAKADVVAMEQVIDAAEARLPALRHFILPGGNPEAAAVHLARTIARRAERIIVALALKEPGSVRPEILEYMNRLSDLLFVLARAANHDAGTPEVTVEHWQKESERQ